MMLSLFALLCSIAVIAAVICIQTMRDLFHITLILPLRRISRHIGWLSVLLFAALTIYTAVFVFLQGEETAAWIRMPDLPLAGLLRRFLGPSFVQLDHTLIPYLDGIPFLGTLAILLLTPWYFFVLMLGYFADIAAAVIAITLIGRHHMRKVQGLRQSRCA